MATSASLELPGVWLSLATDLAHPLHWNNGIGRSAAVGVVGERREYAAGVFRFIKRESRDVGAAATIPRVTREEREIVESWVGHECLYRDGEGRKIWGVFSLLPERDNAGPNGSDLQLSFQQLTHDEAV